jgi:hypothetical protein
MAKHYSDLSRRALIKLAEDYDDVSGGALLEYLTENGERYEDIRPIEVAVDKLDTAKARVDLKITKKVGTVLDTFSESFDKTISGILKLGGDSVQ